MPKADTGAAPAQVVGSSSAITDYSEDSIVAALGRELEAPEEKSVEEAVVEETVESTEEEAPEGEETKEEDEEEKEEAEKDEDKEPEDKHSKTEFTPEQQKIFDKRVGKEVAKRKELADKLDATTSRSTELEQKLQEAEAALEQARSATPTAPAVAGKYDSVEQAEKRADEITGLLEWAADHWDGFGGDDKNPPVAATDIHRAHAKLTKELAVDIPKALQNLNDTKQFNDTVVRKEYPELFDGKSREAQIARSFLARHPSLKSDRNALLILGDMIRGEAARLGAGTDGKKAVAAAKKPGAPAVPTKARASTPAVPGSNTHETANKAVREKRAIAEKRGFDQDSVEDYLMALG